MSVNFMSWDELVEAWVLTPLRRKMWILKTMALGERSRQVRRRFRRAA